MPALIRAAAQEFAAKEAFTLGLPNGSQGGLTFAEVDRHSDAFAVYLREVAGFAPGDRLSIQMPNCLAYPVVVFGALKAGLVMVNTNPLYTPPEMAHQFTDSGSVGLVTIDLFATKVAEVLPKTSIRTVVVVSISDLLPTVKRLLVWSVQKYVKKMIPAIPFTHTTFRRALREGATRISAGADPRVYDKALTHDSLAALQYTGGTTGVAKGAMLTHGNLLANIEQCLQAWRPWLRVGEEVMLTALPLYHIFAFTANLMVFFVTGGRDILVPSPRPLTEPAEGDGHRARHLVHRRQHAVRRPDARELVRAAGVVHVPRLGRRRHGAGAGGGRALGAGDAHAHLSGLRAHRDLAGRHAQPVPPREARLDRRAAARHRRPHRGRRRPRRAGGRGRRADRARARR